MCFLVLVFLVIVAQINASQDVTICLAKQEMLKECPGLADKYLNFGGPDTSMLFRQTIFSAKTKFRFGMHLHQCIT
ncbi:unnamed protein product [Pieris macdunnoughi]|uniref:Uncharacterized protein n=1 Tax=Pieris macdunnoughi TaxID=345717 RepID=A0A821U7K4_9NEOP|nr:unnamed protein product [Pieris macdunnoughi]